MNLAFEYYGMLTQRFVWGPQTDQLLIDELDSAAYGAGQIYYPLADQQQSIIDAAKYIPSAGATKVVTHRVNDAYSTGGSYSTFEGVSFDGSLFAYTGRFLDNMTGLQWHTYRWYDPYIGRWLTEDPIGFNGDPWNLYRYVGNSPTNAIDPSGLQPGNEPPPACYLYTSLFGFWSEVEPGGGEVEHAAEADPEGLGAGGQFGGAVVVAAPSSVMSFSISESRGGDFGRGCFLTTHQTDFHSASSSTAVHGKSGLGD